jgi:hypothetical protein
MAKAGTTVTAQKMNDDPVKLIDQIFTSAQKICEVAKTANKNGKSLSAEGFYGNKFHELTVELAGFQAKFSPLMAPVGIAPERIQELDGHLVRLKSPKISAADRNNSLRQIQSLVHTILKPAFDTPPPHPTPRWEHVLPMAVVNGTRGYIENVVLQANACYEARCFDACSVMIRKLVEMLLIEVYEMNGKAAAIKNGNGDYFMLSDVISTALQDNGWNFGRETKQAFPRLKNLGDRAAHNRRFLATKADVDSVLNGLRVTVDDLLHMAHLK